jgi:hypothetical protein
MISDKSVEKLLGKLSRELLSARPVPVISLQP